MQRWLATGDPAIPRRYGATWAVAAAGRSLSLLPTPMKVLLVTLYFPPAGGGGVQRPLKFATHLPALGIETHVLAPDDPKWVHRDDDLPPPTLAWVHRARYVGPRGRKPAEELHGTHGARALPRQRALLGRRLLVPDENVSWNLTAIPAAIRIVRQEGIDVVLTTSPPGSVHLIGAAVQARDRREVGRRPARLARRAPAPRRASGWPCARRSRASTGSRSSSRAQADAIVTVSEAIAEEMRALEPHGPVRDDRERLRLRRLRRARVHAARRAAFRITHAGSFFGKRDPRPFLTALASGVDGVVARFLGDFRSSRPRVGGGLGLGDRRRADRRTRRAASRSSCSATPRRCCC